MPSAAVNGVSSPTVTTGYTDTWVYSQLGLPSARVAANGNRPLRVVSGTLFLKGNGGTRTCSIQVGGSASSAFAVSGSGTMGSYTAAVSAFYANGGTTTIQANLSASTLFGRAPVSGIGVYTPYNSPLYSNASLAGSISYQQVPTAPLTPTINTGSAAGELDIEWDAPTDNGDTALTGYRIQWSTSASFSVIAGTADVDDLITDYTINGLAPGVRYYVRIAALNAVTALASTSGPWSAVVDMTTLAGLYESDGADGWTPVAIYEKYGAGWILAAFYESDGADNWDLTV